MKFGCAFGVLFSAYYIVGKHLISDTARVLEMGWQMTPYQPPRTPEQPQHLAKTNQSAHLIAMPWQPLQHNIFPNNTSEGPHINYI